VKITGDGKKIEKCLSVVNFGFTVLDEREAAYSAVGNHCIAIIKEQEEFAFPKLTPLRNICLSKTSFSRHNK